MLRKRFATYSEWLRHAELSSDNTTKSILVFVFLQFVRFPVILATFVVEIPTLLNYHPMDGFNATALRDSRGLFLESYSAYLRRMRISIATVMLAVLVVASQFYILGYGVWLAGRPTIVSAYTVLTSLSASHDVTSAYNDDTGFYTCDSFTATILSFGYTPGLLSNQAKLQFSIGSIPTNAVVTKVELSATVSRAAAANDTAIWQGNDDISYGPSECEIIYGTSTPKYTTVNWNTIGTKVVNLGSSAVSDVQTKVTSASTSDNVFTLVLVSDSGVGAYGQIRSSEYANSNERPFLTVTYTLPPQAPTGFAKGAITTSSIVWNWTDKATEDTQYNVHNASHAAVTGCSSLAANAQTCTETGLSANTLYERHPNVTDPQGNTDGASASAYTAIETPTGLTFSSINSNSITAASSASLSHLTSGTSGVYFQESTTGTNSGWLTVNSWTKSGLSANTQYSFRLNARNGDSTETGLSEASTVYTLPTTSTSITSSRDTATWLNTSPTFSNNGAAFGAGTLDHYRYIWNTSATHTFTGTETSWSNTSDITPTTSTSGATYYFHVQAYNAENAAGIGTQTDLGPYKIDLDAPSAPLLVSVSAYNSSLTQLPANWAAATDADSGVDHYQYAVGSTPGGTDALGWSGSVTGTNTIITGLSLTNGQTYYVSIRAIDGVNRNGASTSSSGVVINTAAPSITDQQSGDTTPRRSAGTMYNVDFSKSATGPDLSYGQYAVYSGSNKTGTLVKDWTDIFRPDGAEYTDPWSVDFSALQEGINYVSVKVAAEDGLTNESVDVFTVFKDTVDPSFSSFVAAPTSSTAILTWTTNEPTTTQLEYGLTSAYGVTTTLDSALTTSHTVTISGLTNNTSFHARALGSDQAGNDAQSADLSFATATGTHTLITNVQATATSSTSVTVTWTTNELATSKVRYGLTTDYGLEVSDSTLVTSHSVSLTGLTPGATYHYEVLSVGTTSTNDADATFSTTSAVTPPSASTVTTPTISNTGELLLTADTTPTIAGTGPAGGTIFVVVDRKLVRTVLVGSDGKYFVDLTSALSLGTHAIVVRAKTASGQVSDESAPLTITVTAGGMGTTVIWRNVTDGTKPSITLGAVAPVNATVKILIDATVVKTIETTSSTPPAFGFITTITPSSSLSVGKHTLSLITINGNGRPSVPTGVITLTKTAASAGSTTVLRYGQPTAYTVQAGDSLWLIAKKFLGDGRLWTKIQTANINKYSSLRSHPQLLQAGWTLTLPAS